MNDDSLWAKVTQLRPKARELAEQRGGYPEPPAKAVALAKRLVSLRKAS